VVVSFAGSSYTVVGVLPHHGDLPRGVDVFTPSANPLQCCGSVLVRLRDGFSPNAALLELKLAAAQADEQHLGYTFVLNQIAHPNADESPLPQALMVATLALLLIAYANVANLFVARARSRTQETAVRLALGSTRIAVIRWLFLESGLVAIAGVALGLPVSIWLERLLMHSVVQEVALLGSIEPTFSTGVIVFTALTGAMAAIASAIAPATLFFKRDIAALLNVGRGTQATSRQMRFRGLVAVEISCAMALLVIAATMAAAALYVRRIDIGYNGRNLVTGYIRAPEAALAERVDSSFVPNDRYGAVLNRLRSEPGVVSASLIWGGDGSTSSVLGSVGLTTENGDGTQTPRFIAPFVVRWTSSEILQTLGVRIARGRDFRDVGPSSVASVIVDEEAARKLWPRSDAVGRMIRLGTGGRKGSPWGPWMRVVGVMRNSRLSVGSCSEGPCDSPMMFIELGQGAQPRGRFAQYVVRVSENPEIYLAHLKAALTTSAPGQLSFVRSWIQETGQSALRESRDFMSSIFVSYSAVGLFIVLLGINGFASQVASQRAREFGVRIAVGATSRDIMRLVLYDGLLTALVGLALGLVVSVFAMVRVEQFLYGLDTETPVFMVVSLLVHFGSTIAAGLPAALRSARLNPVEVLRSD